jgi:hypothetical protein
MDPLGGVVCRIQPSLIGVVVPGSNLPTLQRIIETARAEIETASPSWGRARNIRLPRVKTTAGIAVRDPASPGVLTQSEHVVAAAAAALRSALTAGGACVRTHAAAA